MATNPTGEALREAAEEGRTDDVKALLEAGAVALTMIVGVAGVFYFKRRSALLSRLLRFTALLGMIQNHSVAAEEVQGWFGAHKTTTLLMATLEQKQIRGAVAEIGVHHGKSFIHLLQQATSQRAFVAIDVFQDQRKNLDGSGMGDYATFMRNIHQNVLPWQRKLVSTVNSSSLEVTVDDIVRYAKGQRVALFSVDGCHTFDCTLRDLYTAYGSLADYGIIMVDDYSNSGWPGVANAVGAFLQNKQHEVTAIAYGENKYYISRLNAAGFWQQAFYERCQKPAGNLCNRVYCDNVCVLHEHCTHYNPVTHGHLIEIR